MGVVGSSATAGEIIKGKVTHVRDVDTIEVSGLPIRLNGLDGPELDERGGKAGKRFMQGLVLHKPVQCELTGAKTYDRWVGTCYFNGVDIAQIAVSEGHARDCPRYSRGRYKKFETSASRRIRRKSYCR
ncbi:MULTISPECIES: thermonuclease family protein [Paracoccaceae]|uniref:thermonuclease family protein n=1 Tax=Paracoccaceae TaxID=31989 RepID=UPI00329A361E